MQSKAAFTPIVCRGITLFIRKTPGGTSGTTKKHVKDKAIPEEKTLASVI